MARFARHAAEIAATAIAGFAAFLAPFLLNPPARLPQAPLFPIVRAAVEHPHPVSFLALGVVGLIAGFVCHARWWVLGPATMAIFPLCTFAELAKDGTSHNLFPLEFVMYAFYSLAGLLGAALAQWLRPRPRTG